MDCKLIHEKRIASYLKRHPEASVEELKKISDNE